MRDGREVVVKIPNPNAGMGVYGTASEVATMKYARENLNLPVPKVFAYCSRVDRSELGVEYIVMEKVRGVGLGRVWEGLKGREKLSIVRQIASITSKLARARFPGYGSLYLCQDVEGDESIRIDDTFAIGPTTGRPWFDDRRCEVDVHRGPWTNPTDTMNALAQREIACLHKFPIIPRHTQQGIYNGPGGYHPTKEAKPSVLSDFLKVYKYILPKGADDTLNTGIIWHNGLHADKIFVDEDNHTEITGIIDWQAVHISPMFLAARHPSLIEFDGARPERFVMPCLPENIDELDAQDKKAARELYRAQILWLYYELYVYKQAPVLLHAFKYREYTGT